jgi:hypothetical protein
VFDLPREAADDAQAEVVEALRALDLDGSRTADVLRATFDQIYDGNRTGRYRWDQLYKTEKTHFGTLVEINLQREFAFQDGVALDFCIVGHDVDAKYSQRDGSWMLPPEVVGELCMVVTANDERSQFSLGIVRANAERLNFGTNRDAKKTLNEAGRAAVVWLHRARPMPPNVLLQLDRNDVDAIFRASALVAQNRVNELFRRAVGRRVGRAAVATIAYHQKDPMKRVRANGGARDYLAPEGLVILNGDYRWQRDAAKALGIEVPRSGEFVSAYVAPADVNWPGARVEIMGQLWRHATRETAGVAPIITK